MADVPFYVRDLTINDYTFPSADGANTEILSTDGAGNLSFVAAGGGGFTSFDVDGDTGTPQTITNGNTLTIQNAAGGSIKTVAQGTDTITIDVAVSGVTPGSYTNTDLTVNNQGLITAAANGAAGGGSIPFLPSGTITAMPNLLLGGEFMTSTPIQMILQNTHMLFIPFTAPTTGQYTTLKMGIVSAAGYARVAFYSVDANDMPDVVVGSVSADITSAGASTVVDNGGVWNTVNTVDGAGTAPTLTRGTKYWVGATTAAGVFASAGRESNGQAFVDDTFGQWMNGGLTPTIGSMIKYNNATSGAAAGDLATTVTVADLNDSISAGYSYMIALEM